MSAFKERADLRTAILKKLLAELEKERDALLDDVANKKGRAEQIEIVITRVYELIIDTNKEEQLKEIEELNRKLKEEHEKKNSIELQKEKEEFEIAKKGIKTPKRERGVK